MGEKTGFLIVLLIFAVGVVPFLFTIFGEQVNANKTLTISNEVQQLVQSEGGVSNKVREKVNTAKEGGVEITFTDESGNTINDLVSPGKKVNILYEFRGYKTKNSVVILSR